MRAQLHARPVGLIEQVEGRGAVGMHRQARAAPAAALGQLDRGEPLGGDAHERPLLLRVVGQGEGRGAVGAKPETRAHVAGGVPQHEALGLDGVGHRGGRGLAHDGERGEADQGQRAEPLQASILALQAVEPPGEVLVTGVAHGRSSYFLSFLSSGPAACSVTLSPTIRKTTLPFEAL